jgi:disulfide bond formation protein DsbB
MANLKKETYLKILFILSFVILLTAYTIQYLLGYQPCNLCIIERIPYALAIIILILNYKFKKNEIFYNILLLLIFTFSFLISFYHFGIEQEFIKESNVCETNNINLIIKEDVLKSLQEINISCKNVAFKVFGLSLTTYNMLISIFMLLISLKIYLINNEIKK